MSQLLEKQCSRKPQTDGFGIFVGAGLSIVLLAGVAGCQPQNKPIEWKASTSQPSSAKQSTEPTANTTPIGQFAIRNTSPEKKPTLAAESSVDYSNGDFDWIQYRGAGASSIQDSPALPTKWSDTEGLIWKSELPGRGSSSPIVVGDRVFVTAYTGYGISATEPGALGHLRLHLICKDRESGKTIWQRNIKGSMLTQRLQETVLGHGFASSTPVCDGENVFAFFGPTGVFAFDMNGELVWQQNVGAEFNFFGSSASLTTYKELLIVNASIENKTIYALDKKTGKGVWKIDDIDRCWSLPVFGTAPDQSTEMIVSEEDFVHGYDPETGTELWRCEGVHNYTIAVPVVHNGVCYCNGGLQRQTIAIKLGGRGDVTKTHRIWEVPFGGNVGSAVIHNDVLFVADDNGIMGSYDAKTGQRLQKQRTGTKDPRVYASPLIANEKIYVPLQDEGVLILDATEKMDVVQRNKIEQDESPIHGSLAANGDRFLMRTDNFLYCIGPNKGAATVVKQEVTLNTSDLLEPTPRVDFMVATNRLQPYCYYLAIDPKAVSNLLLIPYKSVITDEQTLQSEEIIKENFARFDELRKMQDEAFWAFMKGEIDQPTLLTKLEEIDKETIKHSSQVRVLVKKLFSKEQMDQHLKEAAERQQLLKEQQNR